MISRDEFLRYEDVRLSEITNMFNVSMVMILGGLSKEACFEIMKNYEALAKQYLPEKGETK